MSASTPPAGIDVAEQRARAMAVKILADINAKIDELTPTFEQAMIDAEEFELPEAVLELVKIVNSYNPDMDPRYAIWLIRDAQHQAAKVMGPHHTIRKYNKLVERASSIKAQIDAADRDHGAVVDLGDFMVDPSGRPLQ